MANAAVAGKVTGYESTEQTMVFQRLSSETGSFIIWTRSIRKVFGISAMTAAQRFRKEPGPVNTGFALTLRKIEEG